MTSAQDIFKKLPPMESRGFPLTDRFGNTFMVGNAGDFFMPPFPLPAGQDYRDVVKTCVDTEMRDGDILVCSFPKTGTHWTNAIIGMLVDKTTEHSNRPAGLLEMNFFLLAKDLPPPRIINTHLPYRCIPKQAFTKKVKVVLCNRNPKDTLVSFYHHFSKLRGQREWRGTFEQFVMHRMEFGGYYGDLFDYHMDWQNGREAHPELEVFETVFEDMKVDPVGGVMRLNEFLGTGCSQELCEGIAQACSFDTLKQAKEGNETELVKKQFKDNKPAFYRKGEVGDWKNHFTVAMNEYFDEQYRKRMSDYKLTYKYTI